MYKETQGMKRLDYPPLHQDVLPTQNNQQKKSDHNFLYLSDRQHKNVPVKIVDPLVNAFSTEISLIFYCSFYIFRPCRKPFADIIFVNLQ